MNSVLANYIPRPNFNDTTTLFSGVLTQGDITLSEPFTNFEYIQVRGANDARVHITDNLWLSSFIDSWLKKDIFNIQTGGNCYWNIQSYKNGSTTTLWKIFKENSVLYSITGINKKITNNQ